VLGAGRSGTSVVTRALRAVGVELGDDFKPPSRKNPSGFFEDAALLKLSKQLRRALGLRPESLRLLDESVWDGTVVAPFYPRFERTIRARFGSAPVWGFKYARTMRLLPFWDRLFRKMGIEPSYVIPIRNPLSVARSRARLDTHRGGQANSDLEWLVNVVPYFHLVRNSRVVVIDYDRLMADPAAQLQRLAEGLDMPVSDNCRKVIDSFTREFLRPGLQHTQFSIEALMSDRHTNHLLCQAYALLDRLARDELDSTDSSLWQQWAEINAGVEELRPVLARIDALEQELRRARWNPLSTVPAAWSQAKKLFMKL